MRCGAYLSLGWAWHARLSALSGARHAPPPSPCPLLTNLLSQAPLQFLVLFLKYIKEKEARGEARGEAAERGEGRKDVLDTRVLSEESLHRDGAVLDGEEAGLGGLETGADGSYHGIGLLHLRLHFR